MVRRELGLRSQKSCTRDLQACTVTCLLQACLPIVRWASSPPQGRGDDRTLCSGEHQTQGVPSPGPGSPLARPG